MEHVRIALVFLQTDKMLGSRQQIPSGPMLRRITVLLLVVLNKVTARELRDSSLMVTRISSSESSISSDDCQKYGKIAQLMKEKVQVSKSKLPEERLRGLTGASAGQAGQSSDNKSQQPSRIDDNLLDGVMDGRLEQLYSRRRVQILEESHYFPQRTLQYGLVCLCIIMFFRGLVTPSLKSWQKQCLHHARLLKLCKSKHASLQVKKIWTLFAVKQHKL